MAKPSFGKKEAPLDYGALVKNLRDKGPEKLYLLWGEEDYLLTDFVSRLRTACVGTAEDEFNAKRMDTPAPTAISPKRSTPCRSSESGRLWSCADLM